MTIYRAKKTTKIQGNKVMCETVVYITKNGRQMTDSDGDIAVLPRKELNKQGTFMSNFFSNKVLGKLSWNEYKVLDTFEV